MTQTSSDQMTDDGSSADVDPAAVVVEWLGAFETASRGASIDALLSLFSAEDAWWRDMLVLTWDVRTLHGAERIKDLAADRLAATGFADLTISSKIPASFADGLVTAAFDFRTRLVQGRGVVRLKQEDGAWRAWTLLTKADDLIDFPELRASHAEVQNPELTLHPLRERETWYEFRERQREFRDHEPDVLVVGAGHVGLAAAARLQHLGLSTLVAERTPRVGDSWRNRYHNLRLHDTKWMGHMPYLPFPDNWPVFAPKEMIADWLEAYAWILQLNVWTSTEVGHAEYDRDAGRWNVQLERDGSARVVHPKHIAFCMGLTSATMSVPELPGVESFRGVAVHSGAHEGGDCLRGKRVVVVGSGASAHDVAQDACEAGAEVTLVQRTPTYVMSTEHGVSTMFGNLYSDTSMGNDEADLLGLSFPTLLGLQMMPPMVRAIAELDAELLEGLERAGFRTSLGPGDSGVMGQHLIHGGGYYIDKGCARMIVEGLVKVQPGEVASFTEDGVVYTDGTHAPADVVVFATGFPDMRTTVRPIVGDELADQIAPINGLDDEGELRNGFRPTGHPRMWIMAWNFQASRVGSKLLALQVKAVEEGLTES